MVSEKHLKLNFFPFKAQGSHIPLEKKSTYCWDNYTKNKCIAVAEVATTGMNVHNEPYINVIDLIKLNFRTLLRER